MADQAYDPLHAILGWRQQAMRLHREMHTRIRATRAAIADSRGCIARADATLKVPRPTPAESRLLILSHAQPHRRHVAPVEDGDVGMALDTACQLRINT